MKAELSTDLTKHILDAAAAVPEPERDAFVESLRDFIGTELSRRRVHPVDRVRWVKADKVRANDYNPNSVAKTEMTLLHKSISHDGYTQPIVTVYDEASDIYVIVDGFHRYYVGTNYVDIAISTGGYLPIVVLDKDINDRMASTVRHNRARGKHSVEGMSNMVFSMLENGWGDADICNELGMEPEELTRLKHITGFSALFENVEYRKSWVTNNQILLEKKAKEEGTL